MTKNQKPYLNRVALKGFKSIKSLDLELMPINILIGANGSGKSNFMSLFTFLWNLSHGRLRNYVAKNGYANAFFHFGVKTTPEIEIGVYVGDDEYHVRLGHDSYDDSLVFKEEYCASKGSAKPKALKRGKDESELACAHWAGAESSAPRIREYFAGCRVHHFFDTGATAKFKHAWDITASDYLYPDAGNLGAFLYRLKTSKEKSFAKSYGDIVEAIKTVAPYFHDFYLDPRGESGKEAVLLKWMHRDHDEPFSANQLSDGAARFICMAALFLQPISLMPGLIVLDEPEIGIHSSGLEVLSDMIETASKRCQIICSTQSVTFANKFEAKDFIVVDYEKGVSVFNRVDERDIKAWLENFAMGDIWSKNIIGGRPEW